MTKEEKQKAIDALKKSVPFIVTTQEEYDDYVQIRNKIIELLEQEPCEDAISRESVIEYIEGSEADLGHDSENELVCQDIKAFPPVNPQPKTDVIEKIKAEIHATAEMHEDGDYYLRDEWIDGIFDKYKAEE